jgi:hypothetical protein
MGMALVCLHARGRPPRISSLQFSPGAHFPRRWRRLSDWLLYRRALAGGLAQRLDCRRPVRNRRRIGRPNSRHDLRLATSGGSGVPTLPRGRRTFSSQTRAFRLFEAPHRPRDVWGLRGAQSHRSKRLLEPGANAPNRDRRFLHPGCLRPALFSSGDGLARRTSPRAPVAAKAQ